MKTALVFGTLLASAAGLIIYETLRPRPASAQTQRSNRPSPRAQAAPSGKTAQPPSARSEAAPSPNTQGPVVAKINGQPIARSELVDACLRRYGTAVLEELINKRIIEQECDKRGITVATEEIDQELEDMAKKSGLPRGELLKLYEQERGVDPETLVSDIIWPRLALKHLAGSDIQITDQDVQESFEANFGERVKARMIMLSDERKAREVWEKANAAVEAGNFKEFERLAMEVSVDPASRPLGGLVQPIGRHSGMQALEDEAFSLNKGDLSKIIQVGSYFVILLCEGRTDPVDVAMNEVREKLSDDIYRSRVEKKALGMFSQLKEQSEVINYLTREKSSSAKRAAAAQDAPSSPVKPASKQQNPGATGKQTRRTGTKPQR